MGIPLFFMELAIGQSLRQGSVGVWNAIHPFLGGLGFASVVICLLVGLYYNMIIAWCFYYLFASFQDPLPYANCPMVDNVTFVEECHLAGRTQYYWYRNALEIRASIEESGGLLWHLCLVLLLSWIVVFLCMMRGVESAGKVSTMINILVFNHSLLVTSIFFSVSVFRHPSPSFSLLGLLSCLSLLSQCIVFVFMLKVAFSAKKEKTAT